MQHPYSRYNPTFKSFGTVYTRLPAGALHPLVVTKHFQHEWDDPMFLIQTEVEDQFYSVWDYKFHAAVQKLREQFFDRFMGVDIIRQHTDLRGENLCGYHLLLYTPVVARARVKIQGGAFRLDCDRPFSKVKDAQKFVKRVISNKEIKSLNPEIWHEVVVYQ